MFSQAGTKPLHVVVVDDERPILDELRLFGWQKCNYLRCGNAYYERS